MLLTLRAFNTDHSQHYSLSAITVMPRIIGQINGFEALLIYETDYYKAAPDWLKLALMNPDWVKQQSEAWSRHSKPENLAQEL